MLDAMIAIGALLFGGVLAARLAERLGLPRLTGHMLCGLVLGVPLFAWLGEDMRSALCDIEQAVGCVIAYCVGSLLGWKRVRSTARTVSWLVPCTLLAVIASCALTLSLTLPLVSHRSLVVAVLSVTLAAVSPTVVVAVAGELHADGPLTRTVFSGVVVADVLLMAALIVLSVGVTFGTGSHVLALELVRILAIALAAGIALGIVLSRLERPPVLFALAAVVLAAHALGKLLGPSSLAPLATSVAAGIVGASAGSKQAEGPFGIAGTVLPVAAAVLFGLEGLLLDLRVLAALIVPAVALVAVRSLSIWLGVRLGCGAARADANVRRWAFAGFLPQAGFALAMVSLLPGLFPQLGEAARALAVAVIALNELVMPAVLRHALSRAGEAQPEIATVSVVAK